MGSLPYERMDAEVLVDTPTVWLVSHHQSSMHMLTNISQMIHNIPQPSFEELVASHLAIRKNTEILKNHSFISCEQVREALAPPKFRLSQTRRTEKLLLQLLKIAKHKRNIKFGQNL